VGTRLAEIIKLGNLYLTDCIQRVGIKEFAYRVDCGNIVRKSCCGQMDARTVHLLRSCLLSRASSQWNLRNLPGVIKFSGPIGILLPP